MFADWGGWGPSPIRRPSGRFCSLFSFLGADAGDGGDEALGVGFLGVEEDLLGGAAFDDFAFVHDDDVVGDVFDDADVVGDEEVGEVVFVLELHEEVEDLCADGEVERGDGLVADDHFGFEGECACDADALALAA